MQQAHSGPVDLAGAAKTLARCGKVAAALKQELGEEDGKLAIALMRIGSLEGDLGAVEMIGRPYWRMRRLRCNYVTGSANERGFSSVANTFAITQLAAINAGNVLAELMDTVKVASLGQIMDAPLEVGGQYRRSM